MYQVANGNRALIDACAPHIDAASKATVFTLALELLLSDGWLQEDEQQIIEYLKQKLDLDDATAEKIIEVMLIRNKGNRVFYS